MVVSSTFLECLPLFTPKIGEMIQFDKYFSDRLKLPAKVIDFLPYAVAEALHGFRGDCRRSLWGAVLLKFDIHPRRKAQESYLYTPKTNYVP